MNSSFHAMRFLYSRGANRLARLPIQRLFLVAWLAVLAAWNVDAGQRKIYVVTDLEGISGVYKFTQTRETDIPLARQAREFFMGDLAAVVRGLRAGGATDIVVLDGHGNHALLPELMVPGAKYITGLPRSEVFPALDGTYAGVVFLGFHAMMGTPDGVLNHTQASIYESQF